MSDPKPCFHSLRLDDLRCHVRLGCGAEERAQPQPVSVSVELRFAHAVRATITDEICDTVCYAELASAIRRHCESHEFHLIERLALTIYDVAREVTGAAAQIVISARKIHPPVEGLLGGTSYRCGDFEV